MSEFDRRLRVVKAAGGLAHKSFDLDFKAQDDAGTFTAYVARFGNVDRVKEVIDPGAFKNLSGFATDGWVGLNHDMQRLPVALIESAKQDQAGLLVTARWHSTPEAQACRAVVRERMAAGKSVKCSIGYRVLDSCKDYRDGQAVTRLTALEIFEASIVNLPANPAADVVSAKSQEARVDGKILTLDALKAWLDAETKAGRVLSRANAGKLREWHTGLSSMCDQLKEMLDAYDPQEPPHGEPDGDEGDGKGTASIPPPSGKAPAPTSAGDGATSPAAQHSGGRPKSLDHLRAASLRARLSLLSPSTKR